MNLIRSKGRSDTGSIFKNKLRIGEALLKLQDALHAGRMPSGKYQE